MSFIQQLEKISAKIFQQSIKTYKLKDLTVHRRAKPKSLVQYLSLYPNKGLGFHLKRKSWNGDLYIKVTSSEYKSHRFGTLRGMQYKNGQEQWKMPKKISGTSKRGIWTFTVGEARNVELDNGLVYTPKDYQAYMQFRKRYDPPETSAVPDSQTNQNPEQGVGEGEGEAQQAGEGTTEGGEQQQK